MIWFKFDIESDLHINLIYILPEKNGSSTIPFKITILLPPAFWRVFCAETSFIIFQKNLSAEKEINYNNNLGLKVS